MELDKPMTDAIKTIIILGIISIMLFVVVGIVLILKIGGL